MRTPSTERIRNVAIVGHSGAGKTALAEALLHRAGVVVRAGTVEAGTTVCDTEAEEIRRQMSLSLAVAPFEWSADDGVTYKINLIDTPGYADFVGEVDAALAVADLALLVVSAVDGVEVGTEKAWRMCAASGIPRMVFVNKEDKPRADFHRVLDQLRSSFQSSFVPLELPLGEEERFRGVADVLTDEGLEYGPSGEHRAQPLPDEVAVEERRLHEQLVEEIVSGDDDQLERYLSGDVPTVGELERTLAREMLDGLEVPVLVGSALTGVGIDRLADYICELGPSPADRPATVIAGTGTDGIEVAVAPDNSGKPLAYVFKTVADQFVGQVSLFKVLSGSIAVDDRLVDTRTGTDERLHALFHVRGKAHLPVDRIVAGDLGAVAKLTATATGSTLAPKDSPVRVADRVGNPPSFGLALTPRTQADDDKLSGALSRLLAEDPHLVVERHEETGQTVLRAAGDTHVAVALERLARKFGVNVDTEDVRVPYRETIVSSAEAEGKVKKQSGGHGQFAVANLRVSPMPRGSGSEFVSAIVGGSIPKQFVAAVEKGVEEAMSAGGVHGFPVVDVRVECYDGKTHSVDSSDMAFRTAGALGLREAMQRAGAAVLEPISTLTVMVPEGSQGDVLGDINARRGRVLGTSATGNGVHEIVARVPAAEIQRYAVELRSLTSGRGTFTAAHDHYELVPDHLVDKVKQQAKPAARSTGH
ncbi:MAG: elongation factor G [Actinomycetota bacterium]|nr:elongation factor G [Actinomycetota bacterium]